MCLLLPCDKELQHKKCHYDQDIPTLPGRLFEQLSISSSFCLIHTPYSNIIFISLDITTENIIILSQYQLKLSQNKKGQNFFQLQPFLFCDGFTNIGCFLTWQFWKKKANPIFQFVEFFMAIKILRLIQLTTLLLVRPFCYYGAYVNFDKGVRRF